MPCPGLLHLDIAPAGASQPLEAPAINAGGFGDGAKVRKYRGVRALLLETLHPKATDILTAAGIAVENRDGALDEDELIEALQGVQLLGIRSKTHV